ncbi:MAG: beta-galactosidase [Planctomycetota bacterium]
MKKWLPLLTLLLCVLATAASADEAIWIEGEDAGMHSFNNHEWYSGSKVNAELLSDGEWLAHYSDSRPAVAQYKFDVQEGGTYTLWLRCNPHQVAMKYSVDAGAMNPIDTSDVRERQNLLTEGIDVRFIGWVRVADLELSPGSHRVMLRAQKGEREAHAGIDALALTNYEWTPAGLKQPEAQPEPGGGAGAAAGPSAEGKFAWVEGENPDRHNFNMHGWYSSADVDREALSGGGWLAHYSDSQPAQARWRFRVEQPGEYAWWVRLNPFQISHQYSLDGGQWQELQTADTREEVSVLEGGQLDIRKIAWVKVGQFDLDPGVHTAAIRVQAGQREAHSGIDCMTFVAFPWAPTGVEKPTAPSSRPTGPDTWFPIYPADDEFSDASIIDMRSLVDRETGIPAGKYGHVQRDGKDVVLSERPDRPVKFWGLNAGPAPTEELQRQQAKFYAKHGLNMLRKHTVQAEIGLLKETGPGGRGFDPERLDRFDRWFAILKENGIYMTWSCFYPHAITPADGYPRQLYAELPDRGKGKSTGGFVNFMPRLQDAEWEWLRTLLQHENPYTGMKYVNDPAVAVIEVHNEDCIFFHSPLNDLAGEKYPRHTAVLKRKWAEWLKERYGSDRALRQAWGQGMRQGDSVDNPEMGIYGGWQMTAEGPRIGNSVRPAERKRMGDFIRFLAETQRSYYERRRRRLRELGYEGITVSTAWRAGGAAADPANLWADDAMDMIDRHNYFGGGAGGHDIAAGEVSNETHMGEVGSHLLSTGFYQVEDKPFSITEWTQKPPNQWKAEAAPLFAFYGMGLQGWDASYHFAGSRPRMGGGWPGMGSYVTETPHYIGQFPAIAFALYHGHVQEGPIAAARRLSVDEIFQGIDALSQDFTGGGYDQKELQGNLETPREVLGIGRVTVKIADGLEPSKRADWSEYWDRSARKVQSMTDQLTWDYADRVVTVHGQKTQAVIGFAGGGSFDLPGARVQQVETPFVSLIFTPLDDRPLAESEHILITAMARDKQSGAEYNADGTELLKTGKPPLLLEPVQATLELKGPEVSSVKVVDMYGVPTDRQVEREGNRFRIDGRYATYYYEVKR